MGIGLAQQTVAQAHSSASNAVGMLTESAEISVDGNKVSASTFFLAASNAVGGILNSHSDAAPRADAIATDSTKVFGSTTFLACGQILAVNEHKVLLPPNYQRFISWGFTDGSLRLGTISVETMIPNSLDEASCLPGRNGGAIFTADGRSVTSIAASSERTDRIFEQVDVENILCVAAPAKDTLVTGGMSTVIRVWRLCSSGEQASMTPSVQGPSIASVALSAVGISLSSSMKLHRMASLYGHAEAVFCLAASASFNVIVSGSSDRSVIMWDLNRLRLTRQLSSSAENPGPIAAVAISEADGKIATCSASILSLFDLNGYPLASIDTSMGVENYGRFLAYKGQLPNSDETCKASITALSISKDHKAVLVGDSAGNVNAWSIPLPAKGLDFERAKPGELGPWVKDET
ncbi:WD repeat and FYVE domain-containing protein 3, partial [Cichlidogyrus casuarinus]